MPNHVSHFAIHADDLPRATRFYGNVFGWKFQAWGPPEFFLIDTGPGGIGGALQKRRTPITCRAMVGYECTIGVDSIDAIISAVATNGGEITMPKVTIPSVGTMCQFHDTEGNLVGAMEYESPRR